MSTKIESRREPVSAESARTWARAAGVLFLVSFAAGGFGEFYAPSRVVVPGDAAATAANVNAFFTLFRLGFAGYLVEAMCDITLSLVFYVLLRPVQRDLSLLAAFFGLVSTAVFAGAELFYFAASVIGGTSASLKAFSADQLNALVLLSLRFYGFGGGIFLAFYGVAWIVRGYLIARSGYLPKVLGFLMALGGLGFVARNFALVLAPASPTSVLLLPMIVSGVLLAFWLLVRGVDAPKWEEKAGPAAARVP